MMPAFTMDSRDESLPMSPTKHFVTIIGPTSPISQSDIMRTDHLRDDGDLCEEEEEEEEEEDQEDGGVSWYSGTTVGSRLGLLEAIVEEDSESEKEVMKKKLDDRSLAEALSLGYFDIPVSRKIAPLERPTGAVADLETDHFGRPLTAERPTTPLPEKREQMRLDPSPFMRSSSSSACIDCIASGGNHHHGRPPVPPRASPVNASLGTSLKPAETPSEILATETTTSSATPAKSNTASNFSTPPKPSIPVQAKPKQHTTLPKPTTESPAPTPRTTAPLSREFTPPREATKPNGALPTPPKDHASNPHEHPHEHPHERKAYNPATPARQRASAVPPTPPTTPARRKSLPPDIRKSGFLAPKPVEEEPARPTTSSGIADQERSEHGDDNHKCPFSSRDRPTREMHHAKSYSFHSRSSSPEFVRGLSHSYSASDLSRPRVSSSPEPSRLGYSRPTTPELSRLSQTFTSSRPITSGRPSTSDGIKTAYQYSRPSTPETTFSGIKTAYQYSRPSTPEITFTGTGTKNPYADVSDSVSWMPPPPPPPTVSSSTGTSPSSSLYLPPLAPAINFRRGSRSVARSISAEDLSAADRFFSEILAREREAQYEPESPEEELEPVPEEEPPANTEIPEIKIIEPGAKTIEPETKTVEPETAPPLSSQSFFTTFLITRTKKYYHSGPRFWNLIISLCFTFLLLGTILTTSTTLTHLFGIPPLAEYFGEGQLLEDLSPHIALLLYASVCALVTITSSRALNTEPKQQGVLAELLGPKRAAATRRRLKGLFLLCLIGAGTSGLYLGGQTIGPPLTAAVSKGVTVGLEYWETALSAMRATPVEAVEAVVGGIEEDWEKMDFMYFQPDADVDLAQFETAEDKGYFGDDEEIGWGAVVKLGLALVIAPAGAVAWRQRRGF